MAFGDEHGISGGGTDFCFDHPRVGVPARAGVPSPLTQADLKPQKDSLLSRVQVLEERLGKLRERWAAEMDANEAFKKDVVAHLKRICGFVGLS